MVAVMIKGGLRWVQALGLQVTSAIPSDFEFPSSCFIICGLSPISFQN